MKVEMRSATAKRRAGELYPGPSLPLSAVKEGDEPLSMEWWESSPHPETAGSTRHVAAMTLYLEIAAVSTPPLSSIMFPARFDFSDARMRPDKGVIKTLLGEGLVVGHFLGAQLVFELTDAGKLLLGN